MKNDDLSTGNIDLRVLTALRRIIRAIDMHSRQLTQQHQITIPQLVCLMALEGQGPLHVQALSKQVHLNPSTVVGILDRLEQKGHVERRRNNGDRRKVSVSITPVGKKLIDDAPPLLQQVLGDALHQLPELEQVAIAMSLERIVEMIEVKEVDASPVLETGPIPNQPPD